MRELSRPRASRMRYSGMALATAGNIWVASSARTPGLLAHELEPGQGVGGGDRDEHADQGGGRGDQQRVEQLTPEQPDLAVGRLAGRPDHGLQVLEGRLRGPWAGRAPRATAVPDRASAITHSTGYSANATASTKAAVDDQRLERGRRRLTGPPPPEPRPLPDRAVLPLLEQPRAPEQQQEDEHRVRGRVAVLRLAGERPAVRLGHQDVGGAVRLTARDQEHDVEHVEGPDRPER